MKTILRFKAFGVVRTSRELLAELNIRLTSSNLPMLWITIRWFSHSRRFDSRVLSKSGKLLSCAFELKLSTMHENAHFTRVTGAVIKVELLLFTASERQ